MALDYDKSYGLTTNIPFRGRVKVACLRFATSIQIEDPVTPAHNARLRWAGRCFSQPDQVAGEVQSPTVLDPAVQGADIDATDGDSTVNDAALQAAVEGVVNKFF
jgi:hypothetical protein